MSGARTYPTWFGPHGRSLLVLGAGFGLSVQVVPRGSPAVPIWLRIARGLRWPCTYERTCVFICACECGTHVYSTVPVRGLSMGCVLPTGRGELRVGCGRHVQYERTCVFICACDCGTHVYSRPGYGLRTPYRAGCTARTYTGACALHFRVCTCGTVFGLGSASSVSFMCMCVCTAVGMCSPSVVPLVVSTCMRALYSIWHGGLGGVRGIH